MTRSVLIFTFDGGWGLFGVDSEAFLFRFALGGQEFVVVRTTLIVVLSAREKEGLEHFMSQPQHQKNHYDTEQPDLATSKHFTFPCV